MTRKIIVSEYDETWKTEFHRLKSFFEVNLSELIHTVEHVGSTSIPGLAAKPILDTVLVIDGNDFLKVKSKLIELGYTYEGDKGIKGREAFDQSEPKLDEKFHNHNLYVCDKDAEELKRYRAFREYLKSHPKDAFWYGKIKKEAAKKYPHDITAYMDYKGEIIAKLLTKALQWADKVPQLDTTSCQECESEEIETEFQIVYLGDGNKEEKFEYSCETCGHLWSTTT